MLIDFLVADNRYDTTEHFSRSFCKALTGAGATVRSHKVSPDSFSHVISSMAKELPDWTLSFSDITLGEGCSIGNVLQIPHFSYLIDPAIYFLHHFQGDYSRVSCVDEGECEFVKNLGFTKVDFLPHAVDRTLFSTASEKSFETVFFGSCIDYEELELTDQLKEAANKVLTTPCSILEALVEMGIEQEELISSHHLVDLYTRGKERVEALRLLPEVTIWGAGPWEKFVPHAKVYSPLPFHEVVEVMRRAKFVLNSSPRFKRGYHERIFTALASGAGVITAHTPFLEGFDGVLTYPPGEWDKIPDLLLQQTSVDSGANRVLEEHTWDHRACSLLKHLH
ncbi:MAG: hypothetical protein S4CHLAM45_06410 [Chlamydiales bacterium]|nr:hypothetical protein [Chlamydiales bacterium]MCH9619819.1 hypothetical protein [Chlamydiales bacterium]MCH9622754.1 hypothetical protein [Chlamydiales bacterium]